jgi:hypothetical protein
MQVHETVAALSSEADFASVRLFIHASYFA